MFLIFSIKGLFRVVEKVRDYTEFSGFLR